MCAVYLATVMTLSDCSIKQGTTLDTISYLKLLLSKSQNAYNTRRSVTFAAIQEHFDFTGDNIYKIDLQLVIKKPNYSCFKSKTFETLKVSKVILKKQ